MNSLLYASLVFNLNLFLVVRMAAFEWPVGYRSRPPPKIFLLPLQPNCPATSTNLPLPSSECEVMLVRDSKYWLLCVSFSFLLLVVSLFDQFCSFPWPVSFLSLPYSSSLSPTSNLSAQGSRFLLWRLEFPPPIQQPGQNDRQTNSVR